MDRLKILHYPLEVRSRGMEMYMAEHWRFMDRSRFVCDFVTFSEGAALEPLLSEDGGRVFYIPFKSRQGQDLLNRMEQILRGGQYDVLHLHLRRWSMRDLAVLELAQRMGVPRILIHAHGGGVDKEHRAEHEQARARLQLPSAAVLCACSLRAGTFMFGKHAKRQPVHILKNAVDMARFSYTEQKEQTHRAFIESISPNRQGSVLTAASIDYGQKNFPLMTQVVEQWVHKNPQGWWGIVGEGPHHKKLVDWRLTIQPIYCNLLLETWAIEKFMQSADCFLFISNYEGVPRVLLEAQASGLPCLVSEEAAKDVPCSALVRKLPLTAPAGVWADQLARLVQNQPADRSCARALLRDEGYDVRSAVRILERLYEGGRTDVPQ